MQRIIEHIERLLFLHDCVIIPGFGGFVLQEVPAICNEAEHTFYPQGKEIVFNPTLKHNDGLLCESYMQAYTIGFKEAQSMLKEDVDTLKSAMAQRNRVSLGRIGAFHKGNGDTLVFHPSEGEAFGLESYGLAAFHLLPLQTILEEGEKEAKLLETSKHRRKDVYYIPVSRTFLRIAGASVAVILLFFILSTPVKDVNPSAYTAGFIPGEIVTHAKQPADKKVTPLTISATDTPKEKKETLQETPALTTQTEPAKKAVPAKQIMSDTKKYYIVIASLPNEGQAKKYLSEMKLPSTMKAGVVIREGKVRVYADQFTTREEAESYLSTLRTNERFSNAWLFISR